MPSYLVTYELHEKYSDYGPLADKITALSDYWFQYSGHVWIIVCPLSAGDLHTLLTQYLYKKDKVLIVGLTGKAAWTEGYDGLTDWMHKVF